jgi:hypothetical protein
MTNELVTGLFIQLPVADRGALAEDLAGRGPAGDGARGLRVAREAARDGPVLLRRLQVLR